MSVRDATAAVRAAGSRSPTRQELAGDDRTESDESANDQDSADGPAAEERQDEDGREQRRRSPSANAMEGSRTAAMRDEDERHGGDSGDRLCLSRVVEPLETLASQIA